MGWTILTPSGSLIVSSGTITLTSSTINLPINPNNVTDKSTGLSVPMPIPMSLPMILSYGIENRTLVVSGVFFIANQSAAYIETNYLIPLRNATYRVVTVLADDTRYDGDYILQEFQYTEVGGVPNYFTYTMTLQAFSIQVVL